MGDMPHDPAEALEFVAEALTERPELIVHGGDLPATARALRGVLAASGCLYDRGIPVKVVRYAGGGPPLAVRLTVNSVVVETHRLCRPVKLNKEGERAEVTLPDRAARMYLDMAGDWGLPSLAGITTAPLLASDGAVRMAEGYDANSGLWCSTMPRFRLPERPARADAEAAFLSLRKIFRTFPFADAARCSDASLGVDVVELCQRPGRDESAFIAGLMTAICRASLWIAPGLLVSAAAISGSGTGKGCW